MKISVISPVLNEVDFIGHCIMQILPYVHEFVYALDEKSNDGTRELLSHIKDKYAHEKLTVIDTPNFHPTDMPKYNAAFNACIEKSSGDAVWFLHPDMIVTNPEALLSVPQHALAWFVQMTSYAKDFSTIYTSGRCDRWKNMHRKQFGLHYFGAYGSNVEDFYHSEITGKSYRHHQTDFSKYPFQVADSGIRVNHYCEMKPYSRRLEKMTYSLIAQHPQATREWIDDRAAQHPRVTLEDGPSKFGVFTTGQSTDPKPSVFEKYGAEFDAFKHKEEVWLTR